MSRIAEKFNQLPSVVANDLDNDPGLLSLVCLEFLAYAQAKNAFDSAKDDKALKPWSGSRLMESVKKNTFEIHKDKIAARKGQT